MKETWAISGAGLQLGLGGEHARIGLAAALRA
jgi:hypothetical protein